MNNSEIAMRDVMLSQDWLEIQSIMGDLTFHDALKDP
jgi:hypothetical protein